MFKNQNYSINYMREDNKHIVYNRQYNQIYTDLQEYMLNNRKLVNSMKMKIENENVPTCPTINSSNNNINNTSSTTTSKPISNNILKKDKNITNNKFNTNIKNNSNKIVNSKPITSHYTFVPTQPDKLFWCFYIFKNGIENYNQLGEINVVHDKKIKIEYIQKMRLKKNQLKPHKIATQNYVENYLLNEDKIDLKSFLYLCVFEGLNVMYINKKTFYEKILTEEDDEFNKDSENKDKICVLSKIDGSSDNYGCEINISNEKITYYREKYYHLENIDKPVKTFSAYKLDELVDLCNKLGIDIMNPLTNKKKTKKEMYESIVQYF